MKAYKSLRNICRERKEVRYYIQLSYSILYYTILLMQHVWIIDIENANENKIIFAIHDHKFIAV